ncbi:GENERAL NEGATIVE REGULATOR OF TRANSCRIPTION [Encephalitozoon cuniculi GB-M1]|uniref:GENERAL NEGATIVE REGULATOR OF TRANSCRIPTION n=2 Tax=Encephalitozoon cuniculi TaxID=6035 RepID=Q8SSK2_ENCCU|nr:general negative regulator of transcription [Encephalitozoon cuniculi GB-M1]AGE96101.1 general negative regulator of transcription [Encephalitozoon cuniculi]KMV66758.1 general negative regulator of transcription [Encephalitozoon cuniculi EcunIII-L]UYI28475.1 general negative regulator of transcription [Encephalitozoon cuniculi]CAD24975.1 GENERAL NEGATIVE REGULATOR OF TRANSCRIPTION [Encephalitozoon cuniculi GB-M1]
MANIQKRLEQIQQEQQTIHDINKDKLSEILSIVREKKYQDPSTYYPPSLLSRMLPNCYPRAPNEGIFKVNIEDMKMDNLHEETLFYIFYSFPNDRLQIKAYDNILKKKYVFCKMYKCFVTFNSPATADHVKRSIVMFDPFSWSKVSLEVVFDEKFVRSLEK